MKRIMDIPGSTAHSKQQSHDTHNGQYVASENVEESQAEPEEPLQADDEDDRLCPVTYLETSEQQGHSNPEDAIRFIYQTNPLPQSSCHCCGKSAINSMEECQLLNNVAEVLDHERIKEIVAESRTRYMTGRRVAIIGSGPAALTAAYDLILKGHMVVIYEADRLPGGMLREASKDDELAIDKLDHDIDVILSLGIDLRLNMDVGRHIAMHKLHTNFDAVLDTIDASSRSEQPDRKTWSEWLWSTQEMDDNVDISLAMANGHFAAQAIHDALMTNMWKQA